MTNFHWGHTSMCSGMIANLGDYFVNFKSEIHFLPCSCAFVTHIILFSGTFTEMFQLGDFKQGFTTV
jgi:hypothetical protein